MSAEVELERIKSSIEFTLSLEVYEFLTKASDDRCSYSVVLGGPPCGKCLVCRAKVVERKVRERYVTLGWRTTPCKSCKGSGVQPLKKEKKRHG